VPILGGPLLETPRAVIFDIGRVIINVNFAHSPAELGQNASLSHSQILKLLEGDSRWADWQEGRMAPREWYRHFCEKFQVRLGFEEFCTSWNALLELETILPEALFERLSAECRLALLSNTDPIHVAHIEATYPFVRFFPVRVYSCRVGASKPAPVIYHHALRELDVLPQETIFIDDIRENVIAAEALGITPFHFTSAEDLLDGLYKMGL
jgi:FMN phosphatase YigB (HAD superfamily)